MIDYLKNNKLQIVAINVHGSGSKVFQSFIDNHDEICMIPGYPLMYLYPHWYEWKKNNKLNSWSEVFENLMFNHPSLFDSRIYPGSESLDKLGIDQDEWLEVDTNKFKKLFIKLLQNYEISTKNLILGIHYAYMEINKQNIYEKKLLVYHIHVPSYINNYLVNDFPNLKLISLTRDLRGYIYRSIENGYLKPDRQRLNGSDFILYRHLRYYNTFHAFSDSLDILYKVKYVNHKIIRHEDLILRFDEVIENLVKFLQIKKTETLNNPTFGGKVWNTFYYDIPKNHKVNPLVLSKEWQSNISFKELYVLEGVNYDFFKKYYPDLFYYKKDNFINLLILIFLILLPKKKEIYEFFKLLINFPKFSISLFKEIHLINLRDYSKNAYYSHKWYNKGLNLNNRMLLKMLQISKKKIFLYLMISSLYFLCSFFRYFCVIIFFPYIIFKRILLSFKLIYRRIVGTRILPEIL